MIPEIKLLLGPDEEKWRKWTSTDFYKWIKNLKIEWKTPNIELLEPDSSHFTGQDLDIVEIRPNFMKMTLKGMGILDSFDQDFVIQKIKILIGQSKAEELLNKNSDTKTTGEDIWD